MGTLGLAKEQWNAQVRRNPANKQGVIYRLALLASHIVFLTA
jgi:hypothetical protein